MRKSYFLALFLVGLLVVSCNNGETTESIKFKTLEGKISKPVSFPESPYDSIYLTYNIAWPIEGNNEIVSYIQHWIIDGVSAGSGIKNAKLGVKNLLDAIADKMANEGDYQFPWNKEISVSVDDNTPFNSYITLNLYNEGYIWMGHYPEMNNGSLTVRLTDGEIFQPDRAIENENKMRLLIGQNLKKTYKSQDPDWEWSNEIMGYNEFNLPMPRFNNMKLTNEGISVKYDISEISSSAAGIFNCVVPFDEVKYILTKYGQEYLSIQEDDKTESLGKVSAKTPKLEESEIVELLKKANIQEPSTLSSEFKPLCKEFMGTNETFMKYGDFPDVVMVEDPDIKIFKLIPGRDESRLIVIFDFIDKKYPHMGWISKQDYGQKICAMELLYEDDKWVVDDYFEQRSTTPDKFNKDDANSAKSKFKFKLENR